MNTCLAQPWGRQRSPSSLCAVLVLILLPWMWPGTPVIAATQRYIQLSSETTEVYVGDAIIIDVEHTGLQDPLDLATFKAAAPFDRETTGTRIAVVGGKVVEISLRRMEFTPDKAGVLIFGPLQAGAEKSNSISVKVLPGDQLQWQPAPDDIVIDTRYAPEHPGIHQRIQMDVRLQHRFPLASEKITLPAFEGFVVRDVFASRRTIDNTTGMRTTHWRWLLFPKQSGALTPGALEWSATMIKSRQQRAEFAHQRVLPAIEVSPASEATDWWLPAETVDLDESWSSEVRELKAGDEVVRTLTLSATGVLASQLPVVVPLESRGITQTLIREQRSEELQGTSVRAEAIFDYRVRAQSPVPVFLDTVRVRWWNTLLHEADEAILPARRINVGLPERADLLAALATGQGSTWIGRQWTRLSRELRSNVTLGRIAIAVLLLAALPALAWAGLHGVRQQQQRQQNRLAVAQLRTALDNNDWSQAYTTLTNEPWQRNPAWQQLHDKLSQHLFGNPMDGAAKNRNLQDGAVALQALAQRCRLRQVVMTSTRSPNPNLANLPAAADHRFSHTGASDLPGL